MSQIEIVDSRFRGQSGRRLGFLAGAAVVLGALVSATAAPATWAAPAAEAAGASEHRISDGLSSADLKATQEGLDEIATVVDVAETSQERTTTYEHEGFEIVVVETPSKVDDGTVSPQFDLDTSMLPRYIFVRLTPTEQQALAAGGIGALNVALCAIPGIGWIKCGAITAAVQGAGEHLKREGICQGTFTITFDLNSAPDPWMSYSCST